MSKVILNGIDISESVNTLINIKEYIEVELKGAQKTRKAFYSKHQKKRNYFKAQYQLGWADCIEATINDLFKILGVD